MPDQLELVLLGPWQVLHNASLLPQPRTRHVRALFARLVLAYPAPVARAQLQADLFHGLGPEQAGRHFRTTLYYLRQMIGDLLVSERNQIGLSPNLELRHDVGTFERLITPDAPLGQLQAAMRLVRGPFLDDDYDSETWAEAAA